ncbi:MAG: hypothetical protein WC719_02265 [Patescibacteria group bacterium]|jgi:hypothetical protein
MENSVKSSVVFVLLFGPEDFEEFRSLLRNCHPSNILDNPQRFKLIVETRKGIREIYFRDIYRVSEEGGRVKIRYRIRHKDTGKVSYCQISAIDKNFLKFFFLPFLEHEIFCKKVSMIIGVLCLWLKDSENELGKAFEAFKYLDSLKVECVKKQDFEEAVKCREKSVIAADPINVYIKERLGQGYDEIIDYILKNHSELMKIPEMV